MSSRAMLLAADAAGADGQSGVANPFLNWLHL
jgi:hypothetical protein